MCLLILTPFPRRKMSTIKRKKAKLVVFWKTPLCHVVSQQQNLLFPAASLGGKMNVFFPSPSVSKVIMYLKNKTAAAEVVGEWSVFYPGKDSQNGSCFLVNIASEQKPHTVEKHPAQATSSPGKSRPPLLPRLWNPSCSCWLLGKPWVPFNRRQFVLFQELTKEVLKWQFSLLTSLLSVSCPVRKSNPIVKGSDINTLQLKPGK